MVLHAARSAKVDAGFVKGKEESEKVVNVEPAGPLLLVLCFSQDGKRDFLEGDLWVWLDVVESAPCLVV